MTEESPVAAQFNSTGNTEAYIMVIMIDKGGMISHSGRLDRAGGPQL